MFTPDAYLIYAMLRRNLDDEDVLPSPTKQSEFETGRNFFRHFPQIIPKHRGNRT